MSFKFLFTQNYNSYKLQQGLTQDEARVRGYNPLYEEEKATYWSPNDLIYGKNPTPSSSFVGPDVKDMEINALQHTVDHLDERIDPSNVTPEKKKLVKKQPFSFNLKGQTITFSDEDDPDNNTDFVYDHSLSARKNRKRLKEFLKARGLGDKADATGFIAEYLQTQGLEGLSDKDSKWLNKRADQYEYTVDKNGNVDYHRKPNNWVQGLATAAGTVLGGPFGGMLGYFAATPKKRANAISGFRTPTVEEEEEVVEEVTEPVTDPTKVQDPAVESKPVSVKKYDPNKPISFTGFDPSWGQRAQTIYNDSRTAPVWAQMAGDDNEITKDEFIAWQTKNKVKGGYDGKLGYHTFNAMNLGPGVNMTKYNWIKTPRAAGNTGNTATGTGNTGAGTGNTGNTGTIGNTENTDVGAENTSTYTPQDGEVFINDLSTIKDFYTGAINGQSGKGGYVNETDLNLTATEYYKNANDSLFGKNNWDFYTDRGSLYALPKDNLAVPGIKTLINTLATLGYSYDDLTSAGYPTYTIDGIHYDATPDGKLVSHKDGQLYDPKTLPVGKLGYGYTSAESADKAAEKLKNKDNIELRKMLSDYYKHDSEKLYHPIVNFNGADNAYANDRSFVYSGITDRYYPVQENMFGRSLGLWKNKNGVTPAIPYEDLFLPKEEFFEKYGEYNNYADSSTNNWFYKKGGMIKKHATGTKMVSSQSDNAALEKVLLNATYALLGQASSQGKQVDIQSIIKNVADLYQNNQKELQKIISSNQQLIASVKNALKTNNPELYKQLEQPGTISQLIQEAITNNQNNQTKTTMAMNGTKLNYIKELKGICPEGYEIEYFATGGNVCSHCARKKQIEEAKCGKKMKAKKHEGGGSTSGVSKTANAIKKDIENSEMNKKPLPYQDKYGNEWQFETKKDSADFRKLLKKWGDPQTEAELEKSKKRMTPAEQKRYDYLRLKFQTAAHGA